MQGVKLYLNPMLQFAALYEAWYDAIGRNSNNIRSHIVNRAKEPSVPQVTFYTKSGCHLCEEARDMLDDIAAQTDYELTEIDIRNDPEIFERYRNRIPVIIVNSDTILEGRIAFRDLSAVFNV